MTMILIGKDEKNLIPVDATTAQKAAYMVNFMVYDLNSDGTKTYAGGPTGLVRQPAAAGLMPAPGAGPASFTAAEVTAGKALVSGYGILASGNWVAPLPDRLRVTGTGSIVVNTRDVDGTVTSAVDTGITGTYSGASKLIEWPYFGDSAVAAQLVFSGLTVEGLQ